MCSTAGVIQPRNLPPGLGSFIIGIALLALVVSTALVDQLHVWGWL